MRRYAARVFRCYAGRPIRPLPVRIASTSACECETCDIFGRNRFGRYAASLAESAAICRSAYYSLGGHSFGGDFLKSVAARLTAVRLGFLAVLGVATLAAFQRPDPVAELRSYAERFTGTKPLDCGLHTLTLLDGRWFPANEAALQKSVACGIAAAAKHQPFWTFKQEQGIDSWVALGLVGTPEGLVYRFSYDSAPCGGPHCPGRISFERCESPQAVAGQYNRAEFRCTK
jgi:hypothetical protein